MAAVDLQYATIDIRGIRNAVEKYNKEFHKGMTQLWRDAAAEFVSAIIYESIHYDTGMSAASLLPLAKKVRIKTRIRGSILLFREVSRRKGLTHLSGEYDPSLYRSIKEGIRRGTDFRITYGSVKRPYMILEFHIKVYQWLRWEYEWKTLEHGANAFKYFIETHADEYIPSGYGAVLRPLIRRKQ
jgi:hypothetical protein